MKLRGLSASRGSRSTLLTKPQKLSRRNDSPFIVTTSPCEGCSSDFPVLPLGKRWHEGYSRGMFLCRECHTNQCSCDTLPTDSLLNKLGTPTMRNLILALAAVGVLTVSSSVMAQSPDQSIVDSAGQAIVDGGVQSDVVMPAPMVDHQPMDQSIVAQPIDQNVMTQGQSAMVAQPMEAQPMVVHQHQPAHYHVYRRPAKKQTVFGKMLELERKKNAWLKRTFLGK